MHRATKFLEETGEEILKIMDKFADEISVKSLDYVAEMCENYNEICEFVRLHEEHVDSQKRMKSGTKSGLLGDSWEGNPRRR